MLISYSFRRPWRIGQSTDALAWLGSFDPFQPPSGAEGLLFRPLPGIDRLSIQRIPLFPSPTYDLPRKEECYPGKPETLPITEARTEFARAGEDKEGRDSSQ